MPMYRCTNPRCHVLFCPSEERIPIRCVVCSEILDPQPSAQSSSSSSSSSFPIDDAPSSSSSQPSSFSPASSSSPPSSFSPPSFFPISAASGSSLRFLRLDTPLRCLLARRFESERNRLQGSATRSSVPPIAPATAMPPRIPPPLGMPPPGMPVLHPAPPPHPLDTDLSDQHLQIYSSQVHLDFSAAIAPNIDEVQISRPPPNVSLQDLLNHTYSITIGDIHGNTLTLIMLLIKFGFIEFSNPATYTRIRDIIATTFNDQMLSLDAYKEFRHLLYYQCALRNTHKIRVIRLLGDVLGDRQSNDVLTLAVIGSLCRDSAPFSVTILFSNHDKEFIDQVFLSSEPGLGGTEFYRSLTRFIEFINVTLEQNAAPLERTQIQSKIFKDIRSYLNCIKIFDYEIHIRRAHAGQRLIIFTHAPLQNHASLAALSILSGDRDLRQRIADQHTTPFSLDTCSLIDITHWISSANTNFKSILLNMLDHYTDARQSKRGEYVQLFQRNSPCEAVVWFRWPSEDELSPHGDDSEAISQLDTQRETSLYSVHGHTSANRNQNYHSLDNIVGKSGDLDERATLNVLLSINCRFFLP